jgi:hypothetical protein
MATTQYFEKVITDKQDKGIKLALELGSSSYYGGERLMYLTVDSKHLILDEKTGRELFAALDRLAASLGYEFFDRVKRDSDP